MAGSRWGRRACGYAGLLTLFAVPLAWADYFVVLGSYADRSIALNEIQEFSRCRQPVLIAPTGEGEQRMYRAVNGPFANIKAAQQARLEWQACPDTADAWVVKLAWPVAEQGATRPQ